MDRNLRKTVGHAAVTARPGRRVDAVACIDRINQRLKEIRPVLEVGAGLNGLLETAVSYSVWYRLEQRAVVIPPPFYLCFDLPLVISGLYFSGYFVVKRRRTV